MSVTHSADNNKHEGHGVYSNPENTSGHYPESSESSEHQALEEGMSTEAASPNEMMAKVRIVGSVIEKVSSELHYGTDQLREISRKTEEATTKILDNSDEVVENHALMSDRIDSIKATLFDESLKAEEKIKSDLNALSNLLNENKRLMLNLVGNLSFQDPAEQQMRHVSSMLQVFQSRLLKMVVTFGENSTEAISDSELKETILNELEYASDGEALDQDLVDRVLREWGF